MLRTKGGLNSKRHAVSDGKNRPVCLHLSARQVSDLRAADVLLTDLPELIRDHRGYDSNKIRQPLAERKITICTPPKKSRESELPYDWHLYKSTT